MCDQNVGCQLRTHYFGLRLGASGTFGGGLGTYDGSAASGMVSGGPDLALTWRWPRSDSPQDGSFEGLGLDLGSSFEFTIRQSWQSTSYALVNLWTHDDRIALLVGPAYTLERFDDGRTRHGGQLQLGVGWTPFTSPMQNDIVNPTLRGLIFLGGEGGDGQGGLVIGLKLSVSIDFPTIFGVR